VDLLIVLSDFQLIASVQVPLSLSRLRSATTLGQPACLQCELWLLAGADAVYALSQAKLSLLIGICSIPLQFSPANEGVVVLSQGRYTLPNVLEGWDGAKLQLLLTAGEDVAQELQNILPKVSSTRSPHVNVPVASETVRASDRMDERTQGDSRTQMPSDLVHHAFEVHMLSMNDLSLPSNSSTDPVPVARYLKCVLTLSSLLQSSVHDLLHLVNTEVLLWICRYSFPCDSQPLYTQDVPVQPCTVFEEATFAQHKISLPRDTTILEHLRQQSPDTTDEPSLSFEVYDCFDDGDSGEDQVCLLGRLPLNAVLRSMESDTVNRESVRSTDRACIRGSFCRSWILIQPECA
jgi:hypothetical protein